MVAAVGDRVVLFGQGFDLFAAWPFYASCFLFVVHIFFNFGFCL